MPFTPFHMGPGAAFKVLLGSSMSLMTFGFAQVMTDIEPLIRLLRGDPIVHGHTHTYLGALVIGGLAFAIGWPLCRLVARWWNRIICGFADSPRVAGQTVSRWHWLALPAEISARAALVGAFIGTFSHVCLDSVMHADMRPFWPLANGNSLLRAVSLTELHILCTALAASCLPVVWLVEHRRRLRRPVDKE